MRAMPFHLYKRFPLVDINGRLAKWAIPFHLDNTLLLFPLVQPWLELREITFRMLNPTYFKRGKNKTKQTMKQAKQESIDPRRDSPSQSREASIDCICFIYLGAFLTKFSKCSNNLFTVHQVFVTHMSSVFRPPYYYYWQIKHFSSSLAKNKKTKI